MNAIKVRHKWEEDQRQKDEDERLNKYLRRNLGEQVAQKTKQYAVDLSEMILWSLAEYSGWGKKKLMDFARSMQPNLEALCKHYEMGGEDTTWLCEKLLQQNKGISRDEIVEMMAFEGEAEVV